MSMWRWRRDAGSAAWLAVPAVGAKQWYYTTLAMPTKSALACAVLAVPVPGSGLLGLIILALSRRR